MDRNLWDVPPSNDPEEIQKRLDNGPVLCQVLNKDVAPQTVYNLAETVYSFYIDIGGGDERHIVMWNAYKFEGELIADPETTKKAFGRHITEEKIYDKLVFIGGIPYQTFAEGLDPNIIESMKEVYDIVYINGRPYSRCHFYDPKQDTNVEGKVISQFQI